VGEVVQLVLDASALLAVLHREPGREWVAQHLQGSAISAVNWAEVLQRALVLGLDLAQTQAAVEALGVSVLPFTTEDAQTSARLWPGTRRLGLSLGDRACLALAQRLQLPVATTDRVWGQLDIGIQVHVLR